MITLRRILEITARILPSQVIRAEGNEPYLSKYLLFGKDQGGRWRLHLHRFHQSDPGTAMHSHPWDWAISLILVGGYREHYLGTRFAPTDIAAGKYTPCPSVLRRTRRPGDLNVLLADTFHRVDMIDGECWSLFLSGPRLQSWGFLENGVFTPWRDAFRVRGIPVEQENPNVH